MVRTTEADHEQRASFLLGIMSLKAPGCSVDPVLVIVHCLMVMWILHYCMALGRLQMANIERLANDRLAPGDQVTSAAIQATLHEHRTGCQLGKDASPDGEETSRLFVAWRDLALLLAVAPDEPLYKADVDMAQLRRDLYPTCQVGPRPQCRAIEAAFREHCAPGFVSYYLRCLEEDADRLLEDMWRFGMAMFSDDIVESMIRFLKQTFSKHSARGGGKQKATGQSARGRLEASLDSDADALGQVLQWVFLYFHIHLHQLDVVRHVPCVPGASLESILSLLYFVPQHYGPARQQRCAGHVDRLVEGYMKHAGGCVCMHACEFVHCASCMVAFARC